MIWIDVKYANMLSVYVRNWKVKQTNPYLANCACPICGDSKKSKWKARGFIYTKGNGLFYKCHNCGAGQSLGKLLNFLNPSLYEEYKLERYREGLDMGNAAKPHAKPKFNFEAPVFEEKNLLDRLLPNLDSLPCTNPAVVFAEERKIPRAKFKDLYFIDDVAKIDQLSPKYRDKIKELEPKLLIPFYGIDGTLTGVSCRDLGGNKLRYITIRIDSINDMIYNIDRIDKTKDIYVTEGPFDSMFLDNACATGNADLTTVERYLPREKCILVFDNQPRNKEVMKIMRKAIDRGWRCVVWPDNILEKDINDMVIDGIDVLEVINRSTCVGLKLKARFNSWSKV